MQFVVTIPETPANKVIVSDLGDMIAVAEEIAYVIGDVIGFDSVKVKNAAD